MTTMTAPAPADQLLSLLSVLNAKLDLLPGQIAQAVDQRLAQVEHKIDHVAETQKIEIDKLKKSLKKVQKDVGGTAEEVSRLVNVTSLAESKTKAAVAEVKTAVGDLRAEVTRRRGQVIQQQDFQNHDTSVGSAIQTLSNDVTGMRRDMKQVSDQTRKVKDGLDEVTSQINKIKSKVDGVQGEMDKAVQSSNNVEKSLQIHGSFHNLMMSEFFAVKDQIIIKGRSSEKFQATTLDFFIENWSQWRGVGGWQYSRVWFVPQLNTDIKALAGFSPDGKLDVWLVPGRHPRVMGLQEVERSSFSAKAAVVHQESREEWNIGTVRGCFDEGRIAAISDGWLMPAALAKFDDAVSCDEVQARGFVNLDRVLVRLELSF